MKKKEEKLDKIASIIYRELRRIVFEIEDRRDILFKLWSKERVRAPLLRVLRNRYDEIKVESLMLFPSSLLAEIDSFYMLLDKFIFYVSYTEDMPHTLQSNFNLYTSELVIKADTVCKKLIKLTPSLKNDIFEIVKTS